MKGLDFSKGSRVASSVAIVFLLLSTNLILLFAPSDPAEVGPPAEMLDTPTLGELQKYWFYDGFEYNLTNWVVTGDARLQEDIVYGKGQAALLPSSSGISRSLVGDSQEVVIEAWFYDNGPESKNEVSAYLYAGNASNEVRVGVDTALSQWQYFADFGEKPMLLDAKRYEGWHMLRLHLTENVTVVAIDQMEIAKFPLSAPTSFGARSDVGGFYVDEVTMWSLYRASVWDYKPVEIIPKGYDKWNEGAIWDSKTLYNKADGSFTMWFLASDGVGQYSLGHATSVDGYSWVYAGLVPSLTFKFEPLGMDIMLYGGQYYLYASDGRAVHWFTSPDPTKEGSWVDNGEVLTVGNPGDMDAGRIDSLSITYDPGGAYFMVYSAWSEKMDYPRFFLAKAPDGVHWEKAQRDAVFDLGQLTDGPDIEIIDSVYYIWFHTSAWNETIQSEQYSVYCIMSKDLFNWEKAPQYAQLMAVSPEKGDYKTFGNMYPNPVNTTLGSYLYYTYDVNGARSIYMQSSDYHILDVAEGNVIQYGTVYVKEANCSVAPDGVITYTKGDPFAGTAIPDFKPVPDNSSVEVKMSYWNPMIVDKSKTETMAKWNATSESPNTVTFSMFAPIYRKYIFTVDGKDVAECIPDENGIISFTYSGPWTTHEFGTKGGAPTLTGNTKTWNAGSNGALASVAASWTPAAVPVTGDHIVFDGTSIKTGTWDIGAAGNGKKFGYFTVAAGYGNRLITMTAPQLNITKMQVDSGKFSWAAKRMVCYRDFNVTTTNAWTGSDTANLTMQGNNDGVSRQLRFSSSNIGTLGCLVIGDNTTLYNGGTYNLNGLIVNGTGGGSNVNVIFNITNPVGVLVYLTTGTAGKFINYGWIRGDFAIGAWMRVYFQAGTHSFATDWGAKGRNYVDLQLCGQTSASITTVNQVGSLSGRNIRWESLTNNMLFNWNSLGYTIRCTGTYNAYNWASINLGSSNVYVAGNMQASDPADSDTWTTFGTSTVWATGDTTFTARTTNNNLYSLVVNSTKYWRTGMNLVFTGYLSIQGSFLNVGGTATMTTVDRATFGLEFMGNGTWDIPVFLDPTGRNGHKVWLACPSGGQMWIKKPTDIYIGASTTYYLNLSNVVITTSWVNVTLKSWTPTGTSSISRWYSYGESGTSVRFNQKLLPSTVYDWYVDTVLTNTASSTSLGWFNNTQSSWSAHEFATGKPAIPVITSSPVTQAYEDKAYSYTATADTGGVTWAATTNASGWLTFTPANATAWGRPNNLYAHKSYWVNITATKAGKTGWQNYTVSVQNKKPLFTSTPTTGVWKTKVYSYDAAVDDQSPYGGTFGATIATNWTGAYTYTQSTGTLSFTASKTGYFWWNMTFNDNTGATNATTYQNFTVYVATPYFTSPPVTQAYEDKSYSYQPTVNTTVSTWGYTTNGSAWINQNGGTGQIYGTPTNLYAGRYYWVNVSAATTNDGTVYQNYTVSVQNKKPLFTSTPTTGVWKSKPYSYSATVDDWTPYGGTFDNSITTNLTVSYTWTASTGSLTWTATKSGYFWFNITFNDNSHTGNATTYQNFTVYVWTPYFTSMPVTQSYEDHLYSYSPTVNTTVTSWGWTTNGSAWLSQNPSTGQVYGTPTNLYAGRFYWVNITATTTNDGTIWQNYTVSVQNKKPAFTSTPSYGVWFSKPYSYSATVDDWTPYGGTFDGTIKTNWTASYSWTAGTGSLTWTATLHGYYWFNVTFNDNSHTANATTYQNWTVYIATPYFTSTPITNAWEDHAYSYTPAVNTSVSSWSRTTNAPWVNQNPSTGEIYGTPVNTYSEHSYWVNISAVTVNDGTIYQNYTIFVHNYKPQFTTTPSTGAGHRWTYYYNVSFDDWAVGGSITGLTTNLSVSYSWSTATGKLQFDSNVVGYFWFNITVTDNSGAGNQTNYQNWTVTVWRILVFTSTPLTGAWEDHLYSYSTTTNRSISSWYLDSNATWLSIDGSGVVSGTPDNLNSMHWYFVHVRATCAAGFEWQNFTVTVANYKPHITSTPVAQVWYHYIFFYDPVCDDEGAQGGVYLTVYTNYSGSYSFWTNNGTLMFNASYRGQFWFNITFSDQSGAANQTTYQNFTVTIASNAPAFTSTALTDAWEDHLYSYQTTCNQTVTTWGFSSNASWLSDGSGLVTGTPDNTNSMHWYWVSVSATNWRGTRYQNYTVTVANNITYFTTTPIEGGYFWTTYYYNASFEDLALGGSFTGLTTNFTSPYSWTVGNGKLQLFATPVGYYWFNITVTDGSGAANQTTYQNWTLYVVYAVVFTNAPDTGAWEDHFYHYDPAVNRTGVTWSLTTNASFLSWNGGANRVEGTPDNLYSEKSFWFNVTVYWGIYVNWLNLTNLYVFNNPPMWLNTAGDIAYMLQKYFYNASVDDAGAYGGSYTGTSTNFTESYNWTASTGRLNFTSSSACFVWFNITFDDNSGAANATVYYNWTIEVRPSNLITSLAVTDAWEDALYYYAIVTRSSPCIFWLTTNASFLSIGVITGILQGTANNTHAEQTFNVSIKAQYGSWIDYQNFTLAVYNRIPTFTTTPTTLAYFNDSYEYVSDFDDFHEGGYFNMMTTNYTGDYVFWTSNGTLQFKALRPGVFYFTIYVDDGTEAANNSNSQYFTLTIMMEFYIDSTAVTNSVEDHAYAYDATLNKTLSGVTWSLKTNCSVISINPSTGKVSGLPDNFEANKHFYVNVTARHGVHENWQNFSLYVINVKPLFMTAPLGEVYREATFYYNASFDDWSYGGSFGSASTNFSYTYSWTASTGRLHWSSTGVGIFWWNITISDNSNAANETNWQNFSVEVIWAFVFTSTPVTGAWEDHLYQYQVATNDTIDSWIVILYPYINSWLAFASGDLLRGTPDDRSSQQSFIVTIVGYTKNGSAGQQFVLFVYNNPPAWSSTAPTTGQANVELSYQTSTTDSVWGGHWAVFESNSPYGGNISATGLFQVLATGAGTFWFNILYTDQGHVANSTIYQNFTVVFAPAGGGGGGGAPLIMADFAFVISGGFIVTFTDRSTGVNIIEWSWNFGDGKTSSAQNPTHSYAAQGSFHVTLTIRDSVGRVSSITKTVDISETPADQIFPSYLSQWLPLILFAVGMVWIVGAARWVWKFAGVVVIIAGVVVFLWYGIGYF